MTVCFRLARQIVLLAFLASAGACTCQRGGKSYDSFDIKTAPMVKGEVDIIAVNEGSPEASELRGYTNGQFYQERKIAKYPAVFSNQEGVICATPSLGQPSRINLVLEKGEASISLGRNDKIWDTILSTSKATQLLIFSGRTDPKKPAQVVSLDCCLYEEQEITITVTEDDVQVRTVGKN